MSIQKLKCGGKKKKKMMSGGGPIDLGTTFAKMNNLPQGKLLSSGLAPGPATVLKNGAKASGSIPYAELGNIVGDGLESLITTNANKVPDWTKNPIATLKANDSKKVAGSIAGNTAKGAGIGASIGSVVPVVGTGVGALVGAGVAAVGTTLKKTFESKAKKEARATAEDNWLSDMASDYSGRLAASGYKKGGIKKENKIPLTDLNVVDKMIEFGYHDNRDILIKMTPEERQALIPPGSPIVWEKGIKPTANNKGYNYFERIIPKEKQLATTYSSGLAKGGAIKGKGTSKSDSINMKAKDGSFIVPADNSDIGEELGRSYLGWGKDEKAKRNNGGTGIKVSDGEILFTPEEVTVLKYHGVNLDELAPKAENKIGMKKGGIKETPSDWIHDKDQNLVINDKTKTAYDKAGAEYVFNIDQNKYVKLRSGSPYGIDIYHQGTKQDNKETPEWLKNLPEIAGGIQSSAGLIGLATAGKAPDLTVSRSLKALSAELRKDAEYGLEPGVKSAMLNQTEKARRDTTNAITNRGGSATDVMSNLQSILGTTIDKKYNIELADAAEKTRKKGLRIGTESKIGDQEYDISKIKLEQYYRNQDMFAGLVSAGISNIVGSRQLKGEQDVLREIGTNKPTWKG